MAKHLSFTIGLALQKLSIAKILWIGLIPIQTLRKLFPELSAVGQSSRKGQLSTDADRLDSCTQLFLVSNPASLKFCVRGFVYDG